MRHLLAAFSGLLLATTGCVGEIGENGPNNNNPTPDGGDTTSNKMGPAVFARDVYPAMAKCSGGACHSTDAVSGALGKYYSADAAASYQAIQNAPTIVGTYSSIAPILTHIAAGHKEITYTPEEITKITGWLALETEERKEGGNPNDPPPVDPVALLKTFSGCMTLADFTAANMPTAWGNLAADNNQKCINCHGQGGDGFIASTDPEIFFKVVSEQQGYMLKFFTVDTNVMPAKVIINTGSFINAGETIANHPRFNATTNLGMSALLEFYELAAAKLAAGTCGPPTLIN
jgi:cytochrome c553